MSVTITATLDETFAALDREPDAHVLAGGTDFMVEVNFGHRRPEAVVKLGPIPELRRWEAGEEEITIGAGVTFTEMEDPAFASLLPALAQASRTVGSIQIRNDGTIGGNLGTASPAGDTLPALVALDARVVLASSHGVRELAIDQFLTGPKQNALGPGEVILEVRVPRRRGAQEFLKVGTRNAMVIAVCGLALVVDLDGHRVGCGLGSVGPVPIRATAAETWLGHQVDWNRVRVTDPECYREFGRLVAAAARPIDDHRSTADYRRHAIGVLAERALRRVL